MSKYNKQNEELSEMIPLNTHDTRCAPSAIFTDGSCIELSVFIEMANAYNVDADEKSKIVLYNNMDALNPKKYKKYLVREFHKRLGDKCTTQKCWTEQSFISNMKKTAQNELEKYTFRPNGPDGKFEWLNTINILEVMNQYEKAHTSFKFLGVVPIDFDDFKNFKIRDLDYGDLLNNGKHKLGIVFNLDKHNQPGSHWVSLYIDIKSGGVYFFDSNGKRPVEQIRKLMRRVVNFIQTDGKNNKIVVGYNHIQHQYENSECGVYSINFITRMLEGEQFENICESKVPDKK
jgi:Ulp1 protease family, C-terminal catalytic domain.